MAFKQNLDSWNKILMGLDSSNLGSLNKISTDLDSTSWLDSWFSWIRFNLILDLRDSIILLGSHQLILEIRLQIRTYLSFVWFIPFFFFFGFVVVLDPFTFEIERGKNVIVYEGREAILNLQVGILLLLGFRYKNTRFGLGKSFRR